MWGRPIAMVVGLPHSRGCGAEMWGRPIGSGGCGAELWGRPIAVVVQLPHSGGCGTEMWVCPIAAVVGLSCGAAP